MWYRSLGILRAMTAFMLLIALVPQQLCLHCFIDSIASSSSDCATCECCGSDDASDDDPTDQPCDQESHRDANCPSCIGKLLNPSWSPSAGTDLPNQDLFADLVLPSDLSGELLCFISLDRVLRPPCFATPSLRLRI